MSRTFTKLFSSITESTVWCEPLATRIVWITMLAMADRQGRVWASVPGLANRARVSVEEAEIALERFLAPDRYSRTPDYEGRRIEPIDGGWRLLNYKRYRDLRDEEERRAYKRQWDRTHRGRPENPTLSDKSDKTGPQPTQAEAEAEKNLKPAVGLTPDDARSAGQSNHVKAKRQEARAVAVRAIEYLNEKAGTGFQPVAANVKLPVARLLYDGASEADLRAVVDVKVAEAARGEFDRRYLRPATLWNAEKFAQYLGQVSAGAPAGAKHDQRIRVYAEDNAGKLTELDDCAPGNPEAIARATFTKYRGAPWMRGTRNIVTRVNGAQARFSVAELGEGVR